MTFEELREKYEGRIVTTDECELIDNFLDVELDKIESGYFRIFKYFATSEDNYFIFYCK